jgi:hypothetical protein
MGFRSMMSAQGSESRVAKKFQVDLSYLFYVFYFFKFKSILKLKLRTDKCWASGIHIVVWRIDELFVSTRKTNYFRFNQLTCDYR